MKLLRRCSALPALLLAGSLAACGSGVAAGSGAGVAARVGERVISVDDLSVVVRRALADRTVAAQALSDKAGFQRGVLSRMILAQVYDVAARDLDVSVTDAQVTENIAQIQERLGGKPQLLQAAAGMGLVEADIAGFVRSGLINEAVATKLVADLNITQEKVEAAYDAGRGRFETAEVQHILVATEATARAILARLRGGEDFAKLAKTFSTDPGSKAEGGSLGTNPRGTFFKPFEDAVFTAKLGTPVGPVQTEAGWHVIKVLDRDVRTLAQVRDELVQEIRNAARDDERAKYLGTLSKRLRIRVNPRFGRWDAETASVLPADDELSSPEPKPGQVDPGAGLVPPDDPGQPPGQPGQPPAQPGQPPGQPPAPPGQPGSPPAQPAAPEPAAPEPAAT